MLEHEPVCIERNLRQSTRPFQTANWITKTPATTQRHRGITNNVLQLPRSHRASHTTTLIPPRLNILLIFCPDQNRLDNHEDECDGTSVEPSLLTNRCRYSLQDCLSSLSRTKNLTFSKAKGRPEKLDGPVLGVIAIFWMWAAKIKRTMQKRCCSFPAKYLTHAATAVLWQIQDSWQAYVSVFLFYALL